LNAGANSVDKLNNNKIKRNLAGVVFLILAVFFAYKVYQNKEKEISALKNQLAVEKNKNNILNEISRSEKKIAYLSGRINNKSISSALDKIGDFAKTASVKISKITPQKEIRQGVYTKYPFDIILSAENYHQIGEFISILENSADIYLVENLIIANKSEEQAESVTAVLTAVTIMIDK